jgi:hypothetical protein
MTAIEDLEYIRHLLASLNGKIDWNSAEKLLLYQARTSLENIAVERPVTRAEAEAAYKRACLDAIDECERLTPPYRANWWRSMIANRGPVGASLQLTRSGSDTQTGFFSLINRNRADLSVEWSMLVPEWDAIFDDYPANRAVAYRRLRDAGVKLPPEMAERGH